MLSHVSPWMVKQDVLPRDRYKPIINYFHTNCVTAVRIIVCNEYINMKTPYLEEYTSCIEEDFNLNTIHVYFNELDVC